MDWVRIGLIGSGYMGRTYAECLKRYTTGGVLTAVAGGTRAAGLAADYSVAHSPGIEDLLARPDVDAVLVTSPHTAHVTQVEAAARAGKHVLVEKPMALNAAECDRMIAACDEAGIVLSVIQTWRFRGTVARAKQLVAAGEIGAVRMLQVRMLFPWADDAGKGWTTSPEEGGLLLDAGAHVYDFARWFAGSEAVRVMGTVRDFRGGPVPFPTAMAQIEFANGVIASTWLSWELPAPGLPQNSFRALVIGDHGMLDVDGYGKLQASLHGKPWELVWEQPAIDFIGRPLAPERLEAFYLQVQDFIDCIREGRPPAVTGADGRAAIDMVDRVRAGE